MEKEIKNKIMINCKEATYLFSKSLDTKLCFFNNLKLKFHLMMCKHCKRFSLQIKKIEKINNKNTNFLEQNFEHQLSSIQKNEMKNEIEKNDF